MKKEKKPFYKFKLFVGITLGFIMTSFNGQANNGDIQKQISSSLIKSSFVQLSKFVLGCK